MQLVRSTMNFDVRVDGAAEPGTVDVRLAGRFSEYSPLEPLLEQLPAGRTLRVDLSGVDRINSIGARHWIRFIESARARFECVVLRRCSVPFVEQVNTVAGFGGSREIESVLAPYVCERCGAEEEILVDVSTCVSLTLPAVQCPNDDEPMAFDDLEEVYFGFRQRP